MSIRVLLADDQPAVRAGLVQMLRTQAGIEVAGEAEDGLDAVSKAAEFRPDVVVMDVRMPRLDGIAATRQAVALQPDPPMRRLVEHFVRGRPSARPTSHSSPRGSARCSCSWSAACPTPPSPARC